MIDELEVLSEIRGDVVAPSATARTNARATWDTHAAELTVVTARRAHRGRGFAMRFVIAGALATALVAGGFVVIRNRIDSVKPAHVVAVGSLSQRAGGTGPETFLLVGSDSRAFVETPKDKEQFGDPSSVAIGQRSDTLILVRVDPSTHHVLAVSLPRDLFVHEPGCGTIKINATYNRDFVCGSTHGGVPLLVDTIKDYLDVPVDHVMEIGFVGFAALVNELGGIRINFPTTVRDRYTGLNVAAGCHTLDGIEALSYVRARHVEFLDHGTWAVDPVGSSDFGRMARQQVGLRALARAANEHAGSDPRPLLRSLFAQVTVDSGFTADDALQLFSALRADQHTATLPLPVAAAAGGGLELTQGARHLLDFIAGRQDLSKLSFDKVGSSIGAINETSGC